MNVVIGNQYRFIKPVKQGWLKRDMIGTVREILDHHPAGAGHFGDSRVVVMEFEVDESIPITEGSSVIGHRTAKIIRAMSFDYASFDRDLVE